MYLNRLSFFNLEEHGSYAVLVNALFDISLKINQSGNNPFVLNLNSLNPSRISAISSVIANNLADVNVLHL